MIWAGWRDAPAVPTQRFGHDLRLTLTLRPKAQGLFLSSFNFDKLDHSLDDFEGGAVDEDTLWERIDYWLQRVIPVVEEYKVQIASIPC